MSAIQRFGLDLWWRNVIIITKAKSRVLISVAGDRSARPAAMVGANASSDRVVDIAPTN